MASKLALSLPSIGRKAEADRDTRKKAAAAAGFLSRPLWLIGRLPVGRQLQLLAVLLIALLALDAAIVAFDTRQGAFNTLYISTVGKIRMLSQRLAKAAQQASQGNAAAFQQLRESRDEFASLLKLLTQGGTVAEVALPPSPQSVRAPLDALNAEWSKNERNAALVIAEERNLVALGQSVRLINQNNSTLQELTDEIAALSVQSGGSLRQNAITAQLMMLTQRMAKNANTMLAEALVDPEVAFLLGKDTNTYRRTLQALLQGSDALRIERVADANLRSKVTELEKAFGDYLQAVSAILGNQQSLVNAKRASFTLFNDSEALLQSSERLAEAYDAEQSTRQLNFVALGVVSVLALLVLLLVGKVYLYESRRRAEESEEVNKRNQDAILRLLDEMGHVADGDLTVQATVTEDVTGAIADSINYTIEQLRGLVSGITKAADQVTGATGNAQKIATQLLAATQKQSNEIQTTGQSVLQIANSINEVSQNATQSAQVAQNSLSAAEKGSQAVQNAIRGMNDIRDQIQETSKRIKRLGESSQEIGEIVQLITDITEQTNVLALNAAIQAASAGEAGRGFAVVAEEVQRLAERSAEATKHISAIVKSIQLDTQGTVEAMEKSTQGVIEGARVADEAGQALHEIEQVSNRLAELIGAISNATQNQAQSATQVAASMKGILNITQMTTAGTQKTAQSATQLSALAQELKNSVAGFKLT